MAWGMNLSGMHSVRSFKQAQDRWAGAEPWRNKSDAWRPLQNKRKEHVRLVRLHDEAGYECTLYQTPMVTYYANGNVKLIGHDSQASHTFAWSMTPTGIAPTSANAKMYWQVATPEGERYYRDRASLLLTPAGNGTWQLLDKPIEETEKVLDRKKAAAVRKLLSHYDKWEKMTTRLVGHGRTYPLYPQLDDIRALLDNPEDPEIFAELHTNIGPVEHFRHLAYDLLGVYEKVAVPHNRLPRKQR